jgi:hypothetical protein
LIAKEQVKRVSSALADVESSINKKLAQQNQQSIVKIEK